VLEARVSPWRFLESACADRQNKVSNFRRHRPRWWSSCRRFPFAHSWSYPRLSALSALQRANSANAPRRVGRCARPRGPRSRAGLSRPNRAARVGHAVGNPNGRLGCAGPPKAALGASGCKSDSEFAAGTVDLVAQMVFEIGRPWDIDRSGSDPLLLHLLWQLDNPHRVQANLRLALLGWRPWMRRPRNPIPIARIQRLTFASALSVEQRSDVSQKGDQRETQLPARSRT
jgi:hypothetical protein